MSYCSTSLLSVDPRVPSRDPKSGKFVASSTAACATFEALSIMVRNLGITRKEECWCNQRRSWSSAGSDLFDLPYGDIYVGWRRGEASSVMLHPATGERWFSTATMRPRIQLAIERVQ